MTEQPKNPIESLSSAINCVQAHLLDIEEKEKQLRDEKASILSELEKVSSLAAPPAVVAEPRPKPCQMIPLNQQGLTYRVVAFLREHPSSRLSDIVDGTHSDGPVVKAALDKLRASNTVESKGKGRGVEYSLTKVVESESR